MEGDLGTLTVWSYGFAAAAYTLLAIYLAPVARTGPRGLPNAVMLAAVVFTVVCWRGVMA